MESNDWTEDRLRELHQLMPDGATESDTRRFAGTCDRVGLDPFARQIYPMSRWDNMKKRVTISFQCSIDGFRIIAERAGDYAGQCGPLWCGDGGDWTDVWLGADPPAAAKVGVMRQGFKEPLWSVALFREYVQTKKDGTPNSMWKGMPANQLAKCAESLALRRAFPNHMSGIYTTEEMGQASNPSTAPAAPRPVKTDSGADPSAEGVVEPGDTIGADAAMRLIGKMEAAGMGEEAKSKVFAYCTEAAGRDITIENLFDMPIRLLANVEGRLDLRVREANGQMDGGGE